MTTTTSSVVAEYMARERAKLKESVSPTPAASAPKKVAPSVKLGEGEVLFSSRAGYVPENIQDFPIHVWEREEWATEAQPLIPSWEAMDFYKPDREAFALICKKYYAGIKRGVMPRILLTGPTGSGKSELGKYVAAFFQAPFLRFNANNGMEAHDLIGRPTFRSGSEEWIDGVLSEACRYGAIILDDECASKPAGIAVAMHPLLEREGRFLLQTERHGSYADKRLIPDKRFCYIAADNTKLQGDSTGHFGGMEVQNSALVNRFNAFIHVDYPVGLVEQDILKSHGVDTDIAKRLVTLAGLIRTGYKAGKVRVTMSTRTLVDVAEALEEYDGDMKQALMYTYTNKLDSDEEVMAFIGWYNSSFGGSW